MAALLFGHQREPGMRAVDEAEDVDVDHRAPVVALLGEQRPEQHHAGVVDEDVEAAQLVLRALDERARLLLLADVRLDRERAVTDLLDKRVEAILAAGAERDLRPASANAIAVASPIPDEAPVIAATLPSSEAMLAA